MAKLPFMQLYKDDWDRDTRVLSLAANGLWDRMLVRMHDDNQSGVLVGTVETLSRATHCFPAEFKRYLAELETKRICDVQRSNGSVTVVNRRMKREADEREASRLRQLRRRHGDEVKDVTGDVTPPSRTESPPGHASVTAHSIEAGVPAKNISYTDISETTAAMSTAAAESAGEPDLPAWAADIAKRPTYAAMDVGFVYRKMVRWCIKHGKAIDRDTLLTWLETEGRARPGNGGTSEKNQRPAQQLRAYTETDAKDNREPKKSGIIKPKRAGKL